MYLKRIVLFGCSLLLLMAFQLAKSIDKKISKEIMSVFEIEDFSTEPIIISQEINDKLKKPIGNENLYRVYHKDNLLGYAYVGQTPSQAALFDYLVLFDTDFIVKKVKVLVYREEYGGEIGSKRWLKQFIGKTKQDSLILGSNIVAISGATISTTSMTYALNNVFSTINILQQNNIL